MKILTSVLLGVLGLAANLGKLHAEQAPLAMGSPAPMAKTAMKNAVDGKDVTIAKVAGKKGTLVVFTCNHCPWAKKWEERLVGFGNAYQKKGIGAIFINSNDPSVKSEDSLEATAQRAKQRGFQFPYAIDGTSDVARAFGATKTPEVFLFDAGGRLVYHGAVDDHADDPSKVKQAYLKDALEAVAIGKAPALKETKSLGCGIKFRAKP